MTKVAHIFSSKLGSAEIYDSKTRLNFKLPNGLKIFNKKDDVWGGGSEDGAVLVHVERLKEPTDEIPTILADGNLDLYLASKGPAEEVDENIKQISVGGSYASKAIYGCLKMVKILGKVAYLVLTASKIIGEHIDLEGMSIDIIGRINQSNKINERH